MIPAELYHIPLDTAEFNVIDVETTGLSARNNRVIEIGIVKINDLKIVDRYQTLINPGYRIPPFITQFTGIDDDDVYDAPTFSEVICKVEDFIGESVLSGHNLNFDLSFLRYEFLRNGNEPLANPNVCTLKIARKLYPMLRNKSLSSVTKHLRLKNSSAHRALADAEVTAKILVKMIKELRSKENINFLSELIQYQSKVISLNGSVKIPKKLNDDVISLPQSPGVYYFLNKKNQVIYVGKAKSLRERVHSYFSNSASSKTKRILRQAAKLRTEITNSELTALLLEAEAIKKINPKHNSQLKKYGNKYFIRITKTHKYPKPEISNKFDFDGNDYFGLFISRKRAEKVLNILDKAFALRECTDKELLKGKKCFLAEIERCTAPCIKKNDPGYEKEIVKAYEFLSGKNQSALDRLLNKMKSYSQKEQYEKAAEIKEVIDLILSQIHKSSLINEPVNKANVLFEVSETLSKDYLLMLEGKFIIKSNKKENDDKFEGPINDFYSNSINLDNVPSEEDLEKMKISLNWLVKNRNKVRVFYLEDYNSSEELFNAITNGLNPPKKSLSNFNLKYLTSHSISDDNVF
ncbi:MAG: GIY-YIG nuclease family protein [Ignavibacteriaceae bacterium]|nr:GIY-YIG nuclease family protein [Ignavibacteriaceae bacterium]